MQAEPGGPYTARWDQNPSRRSQTTRRGTVESRADACPPLKFGPPKAAEPLNEAADRLAEALFDMAVGPDDDGDQFAIASRLIERRLAHFDTSLFISHAFLVPFSEQLDTSVAATNGINHGMSVRRACHAQLLSGNSKAAASSWRISLMASLRH